ncbi:MAG: UDP-N-acetylmuramoyl-tripeptide--D-alanyl-D-alanine ligase [Gemmatimonadota bacterium]|nr:UDP-N-acetylmuramoyl-tripeptide--D-alanyl-D-alanine ligase [Gemmatimonadota bacterium]
MPVTDSVFPWTDLRVRTALGLDPEGATDQVYRRISTDTREAGAGDLFVALQGDRFDAHEFLDRALAAGCSGLVIDARGPVPQQGDFQVYRVDDTLRALGDLARFRRREADVPVVGITGSSGKTTAKDLTLGAISGFLTAHGTVGNLNNRIGVPLTILAMAPDASALVLEMGTNQPGEIRELARVAEPTVGVLTTVSETHVELLGDLEGVLDEKLDLARAVPDSGVIIVGDDPSVLAERTRLLRSDVRVGGLSERADAGLRPLDLRLRADGTYAFSWNGQEIDLKVPGRHGVYNALLALAVAQCLGVPAQTAARGVSRVGPRGMRGETTLARGASVILDCYNANPQSVRAALQHLEERRAEGRRIAVLGSMLELGERSGELHRKVLAEALSAGVDRFLLVGAFAEAAREEKDGRIRRFPDLPALGRALSAEVQPGDTVLFKASRGVRLESAFQTWADGNGDGQREGEG